MNASYDPDQKPEHSPALHSLAREHGYHVFSVICNHEENGEFAGVQFMTASPFLPRVGDRIRLEDGKDIEVKGVYFKVVMFPEGAVLTPNVYCTVRGSEGEVARP